MLYRNMYWLLYILDMRFVLFLCTTAVWQFAINEYEWMNEWTSYWMSELPNHASLHDWHKGTGQAQPQHLRTIEGDSLLLCSRERTVETCPRYCARPRLCYVRRYYIVLSWSYSYTLVAGIKPYVRKLQLLTLSVIPPVVAAARGHWPAPKALLHF